MVKNLIKRLITIVLPKKKAILKYYNVLHVISFHNKRLSNVEKIKIGEEEIYE